MLVPTSYSANLDECFEYAGKSFSISPVLLKCIGTVESGLNQNARNKDSDGTIDVGIMQINSSWIKTISWGNWVKAKTDACYNIYVGAWILSKCVKRYGYTWRAVGCYNAGLNGGKSKHYVSKVYLTYLKKYYYAEHN